MAFIKYRGAKHVPVAVEGMVKRHGKEMERVKTTTTLPHRPKGSIDYRSPNKVYGGGHRSSKPKGLHRM